MTIIIIVKCQFILYIFIGRFQEFIFVELLSGKKNEKNDTLDTTQHQNCHP